MPTWSRPTSCELHAVMHLPHACYVPSWHEARSLTRTLLPSRRQWPRLLSSISIRSDKVYGAETAYGGTAQFTRVAQLATQGYQGHGGGRHSSLQARVHLPRMRCLESDAFTSTHMPLVMKIALLEEFPARGRLFRSAAAKCAFLSSLSTYLSLFDPYRDHTPAKEHKNGVQVASFWYHIGFSRPRAHPRSYIILLYAS